MDEEIIAAAEKLAREVCDMPSWLGEAGVDVPRAEAAMVLEAIRKRAKAAAEARVAARRAKRATAAALADVARGLVENFVSSGFDNRITLDPYDDERSLLTSGQCALVAALPEIDGAPPCCLGRETLTSLVSQCDSYDARVASLAAFEVWARGAATRDGKRVGLVRRHALDVDLVERWVMDCARVAPGPITVRASLDAYCPLRFDGPGWTALVMPMRVDELAELPLLEEAHA